MTSAAYADVMDGSPEVVPQRRSGHSPSSASLRCSGRLAARPLQASVAPRQGVLDDHQNALADTPHRIRE
jgi:hypothetical protein